MQTNGKRGPQSDGEHAAEALLALEARFEAERRARIEAEGRLGAGEAALLELETRLREVEHELQGEIQSKSRELEEARLQAETAGRAKTAFLAHMSHEIRTPLSAVMGYANLIASAELLEPELREWSRRLQRSAEHLLALLDDVLDLAKIDAGRMDLHLVPVEPTTVLEEVGVLMEPRAVERGLELIVISETELPAKIRTDPLRLRQILVNLVGNAVKYTPSGKVALHARVRSVPIGRSLRHEIAFDVVDTGVGIAEHDLERLFRPFEQGPPKNGRARADGAGLGLDIARRLARMLGGDISVQSQVGAGSTFTLTLPVDLGFANTTTPARLVTRSGVLRPDEADGARLDGRQVLVVDDTEDNRRIVAHFLGRGGARVAEAASLAEAFQLLDVEPSIDLVLTDLQLPDGDGLDVVRVLRARGDRRPVVALTADAMLETRETALTAGVDDFMVKPIIGNRLVARVSALLRKADSRPGETRPATGGDEAPIDPNLWIKTPPAMPRPGRRHPTSPVVLPPKPHASQTGADLVDRQRAITEPKLRPTLGVPASAPPDVPEELMQRFYVVLAERVYAMEDAIRKQDALRARDIAHRVAGSGSTMGHPELTDLGRALEQTLGEGVGWEAVEPTALRFLTAAREAATRRPWLVSSLSAASASTASASPAPTAKAIRRQ
jgi:signal transduction histidine kinase/CheY-like chemotaxis protein